MQRKHRIIISVEFFLMIFLKIYCGDAARGHKLYLQMQRVDCFVYNKEIVESFNCTLRRNDVTKELLLNTDVILAKDVRDISLRTKVVYEVNGERVNLFDEEVDICESLTNRFDFFFMRMVRDEIHRRSNVPLKCPLKSNILYHMRNFTIDSKYFPPFLPESNWSTYFNFSSEKSVTMGLNAFGTLKRNKL